MNLQLKNEIPPLSFDRTGLLPRLDRQAKLHLMEHNEKYSYDVSLFPSSFKDVMNRRDTEVELYEPGVDRLKKLLP